MKVEPLSTYRQPKYPRLGENIQLSNALSRNKNMTLIAATIAISGALAGCVSKGKIHYPALSGVIPTPRYLSGQEILQTLQYEAEYLGIAFDRQQETTIKYDDIDLELFDEENQIAEYQEDDLYQALREYIEQLQTEGII